MQEILRNVGLDPDADPVPIFQELVEVNLSLESQGPSRPLLVRKAALETALGKYPEALRTCEELRRFDPEGHEPRFLRAVACVGMALLQHGAIPGPYAAQASGADSERPWLATARGSLEEALERNPHDEQARLLLRHLAELDDPETCRLLTR